MLGGRYQLVSALARGGMATVWVGQDTLLDRRVAVKTLHPELSGDAGLRSRFRHEAVAAARLSSPGIVATYDTGEDDGVGYIVMEFVDGPNLRRVLDERGPLPIADTARIGREVATALDHAHRQGVIHRDVKPANVLVPPGGPVKVTDFGIAKAGGGELTRTGTVVGTARYLAPEQLRGEPVDARTDIYALGLVLYEMLTGELPFHGDTEMAISLARLSVAPAPVGIGRPDTPTGPGPARHGLPGRRARRSTPDRPGRRRRPHRTAPTRPDPGRAARRGNPHHRHGPRDAPAPQPSRPRLPTPASDRRGGARWRCSRCSCSSPGSPPAT